MGRKFTKYPSSYVKATSETSDNEISGTIQVKPDVDVNTVVDIIREANVIENINVLNNGDIELSGKYDGSNDRWFMKLNEYIDSGEMTVNHVSKGYTTTISFRGFFWSVSDNVAPQYIFELNNQGSGKYDFMCQSAYRPDGTKKYLHNEVAVTFKLVNGEPYILSGYHIGTQDFDFDEGDPWDDYVEYYQPGITAQVLERIKNNDYEYH